MTAVDGAGVGCGVVRAGGEVIVKAPKSKASSRTIVVPPHIRPLLAQHLLEHAQPGADGLVFPARSGGHLAPSTLYKSFYTSASVGISVRETRSGVPPPRIRQGFEPVMWPRSTAVVRIDRRRL